MKIIHVVHSFYPATGGIEQHVYYLAKELVKQGHEVVVHTTGKGEDNIDGIKVRRHWALNLPFFSSVNFSPGLVLFVLFEQGEILAAHGYGSLMPYFTAWIAWIKRKPFVFTLHGYPKLQGIEGVFQKLYTIFVAPWFLKIANRIIIVSKATEHEITREADIRKIMHIPNGVGEEFFSAKKTRSNAIAYVGRFDKYKRIDILIDAFAKLKKEFPQLQLWLVGRDDGAKNKLEEQIKQLSIAGIEFKHVLHSDMPEIYSQVRAVILPSAYEGFSLVWLEAMASEVPMFSKPVGEAPALFQLVYGKPAENFLFRDKDELLAKLKKFLKNEKAYAKLLKNAKATVKKKYGWPIIAERTLKIYNEAIK